MGSEKSACLLTLLPNQRILGKAIHGFQEMPIYEYQASGEHKCEYCEHVFELMQKLSEPVLALCPRCHNPVQRIISPPNLASPAPSLKERDIEKHGFTQFRKVEKGVYEKTAGKGPDIITDK